MADWKSRTTERRELDAAARELEQARKDAPDTCALYEELLVLRVPEAYRDRYEMMLLSLGQAASLGRNLTQASTASVRAFINAVKEA